MTTHYQRLGIDQKATLAEIKATYRTLALTTHPDKTNGATTKEFQAITEAYAVLSDESKRRQYDAELSAQGDSSHLNWNFSKLKFNVRLFENPFQYDHYQYWNKIMAAHLEWQVSIGDKSISEYLKHVAQHLSGRIVQRSEAIRRANGSPEAMELLRLHTKKLWCIIRSIFNVIDTADFYDYSLGFNIDNANMLSFVDALGGREVVQTLISIDSALGTYFYGFKKLHDHKLLKKRYVDAFIETFWDADYVAASEGKRPSASKISGLTTIIYSLEDADLLTEEVLDYVFQNLTKDHQLDEITGALSRLDNFGLPLIQYFMGYQRSTMLCDHPFLNALDAYCCLAEQNILNNDLLQAIEDKKIYSTGGSILADLAKEKFLTARMQQAFAWNGPSELQALNKHIHQLFIHGYNMLFARERRRHDLKGRAIVTTALEVKQQLYEFWQQPPAIRAEQYQYFKQRITAKLNNQDALFKSHRDPWFEFKANILTALTGIGLILMAINYLVTGRYCLFTTATDNKVKQIESDLNQLSFEPTNVI